MPGARPIARMTVRAVWVSSSVATRQPVASEARPVTSAKPSSAPAAVACSSRRPARSGPVSSSSRSSRGPRFISSPPPPMRSMTRQDRPAVAAVAAALSPAAPPPITTTSQSGMRVVLRPGCYPGMEGLSQGGGGRRDRGGAGGVSSVSRFAVAGTMSREVGGGGEEEFATADARRCTQIRLGIVGRGGRRTNAAAAAVPSACSCVHPRLHLLFRLGWRRRGRRGLEWCR